MNPNESLNSGPDLTDTATLIAQLVDCASGLEQQAAASRGGSAMGGAPYPEQFYRRCAALMLLSAERIRAGKSVPTIPPAPVPPGEPLTDMGSPPRPKPAAK